MGVPDLAAAGAYLLPLDSWLALDEAAVGDEVPIAGEATDLVDFVEKHADREPGRCRGRYAGGDSLRVVAFAF